MKKYISCATKWLAIIVLISAVIMTIGIVLILVGFADDSLQFGLTVLGGLMCILFLSCYFAERSRTLMIDANKIIFPRGVNKNGKIILKRTVVKLDEICSVESKLFKGDKIISRDCFFHTLDLKDGTKITVMLYSYGKKAEKEILDTIQKYIL